MTNDEIITTAKAAYEAAQQNQTEAAKALTTLKESQSHIAKAYEEAKKALEGGKPALTVTKAKLAKAEAELTLAKAALDALVPPAPVTASQKGAQHSQVRAAVGAMLKAAPHGMSTDAIFTALQAQGVTMAGSKPRENLNAYLSRWEETTSLGKGVWGLKHAEVPSFLAPVEVPDFLTTNGNGHVPDNDLPEGFPGRQAFIEAGIATKDALVGKTHDQLRRIKGVGAETARLALEALGA